jgi:hypothetical protein
MVNLLGETTLGRGEVPALYSFTELAKVLSGTVLGIVLLFLMTERTRSVGSG